MRSPWKQDNSFLRKKRSGVKYFFFTREFLQKSALCLVGVLRPKVHFSASCKFWLKEWNVLAIMQSTITNKMTTEVKTLWVQ